MDYSSVNFVESSRTGNFGCNDGSVCIKNNNNENMNKYQDVFNQQKREK